MSNLYNTDTYTWALEQSDALRRRSVDEIDWQNVAEEIESVGRYKIRELGSRYTVLIAELLQWQFHPKSRNEKWETVIYANRRMISKHLSSNPGMLPFRDGAFGEAYLDAKDFAAIETGLPLKSFPDTNPFTLAQAMDDSFWPGGPKQA